MIQTGVVKSQLAGAVVKVDFVCIAAVFTSEPRRGGTPVSSTHLITSRLTPNIPHRDRSGSRSEGTGRSRVVAGSRRPRVGRGPLASVIQSGILRSVIGAGIGLGPGLGSWYTGRDACPLCEIRRSPTLTPFDDPIRPRCLMSSRPFVHLHCHSHYSLLDGASKLPALVKRAKALGCQPSR